MEDLLSKFRMKVQISLVGAIGGIGLLVVAATWIVGSVVETRIAAVMEHATKAHDLLNDVNISILQARRHEKDFLLRRSDNYTLAARANDLEREAHLFLADVRAA